MLIVHKQQLQRVSPRRLRQVRAWRLMACSQAIALLVYAGIVTAIHLLPADSTKLGVWCLDYSSGYSCAEYRASLYTDRWITVDGGYAFRFGLNENLIMSIPFAWDDQSLASATQVRPLRNENILADAVFNRCGYLDNQKRSTGVVRLRRGRYGLGFFTLGYGGLVLEMKDRDICDLPKIFVIHPLYFTACHAGITVVLFMLLCRKGIFCWAVSLCNRHKGRCVTCGYPRAGLPTLVCPECGGYNH